MSVTLGSTTYIYIGELLCGGSVSYDNTNYGSWGLGNTNASVVMYTQIYLEHKQSFSLGLTVRIHQPTVGFNNNTQAIWEASQFGLHLNGTASGDYGDRLIVNDPIAYTHYGPNGWVTFFCTNQAGSVEWTWSASGCTSLSGSGDHTPHVAVPKLTTRTASGGGWAVGHA